MLPIIVTSSPKYAHLIPKFQELYQKHWGEDRTILFSVASEGESWTDQMIRILLTVKWPYFIRLSEEFFFTDDVDKILLAELETMIQPDGIFRIGLQTVHEGYDNCSKSLQNGLFLLDKNAEYLASFEASIYKTSLLFPLLTSGEHIWEAEGSCSKKARELGYTVLVTEKRVLPYKDAMRRGQSRHPEFKDICESV